jgi:hypothetical protein
VAQRSLSEIGALGNNYDFLASIESRQKAIQSLRSSWIVTSAEREKPSVLMKGGGQIDEAEFNRLLRQRDRRVLELNE